MLTNKLNMVIILGVYAIFHFQIFLVSPWSGQSVFGQLLVVPPGAPSANKKAPNLLICDDFCTPRERLHFLSADQLH